jgi:hypothetical protein
MELGKDAVQVVEYVKPTVVDYGSLQALTAASVNGSITDVPQGSPCCNVFS